MSPPPVLAPPACVLAFLARVLAFCAARRPKIATLERRWLGPPDGVERLMADGVLTFHVLGQGLVLRDAGYILINPDGSVAFVNGPHPFMAGDTAAFCTALS